MTQLQLPAGLSAKSIEALQKLLSCCRDGLTGTLVIDFTEGVPTLARRTETTRFGKMAPGKPLTPP